MHGTARSAKAMTAVQLIAFGKELELVESDQDIFKLIGPALVKQEKSDAVSNVKKRLAFIAEEV